jgi:mono/diheme cytochrome c family protein
MEMKRITHFRRQFQAFDRYISFPLFLIVWMVVFVLPTAVFAQKVPDGYEIGRPFGGFDAPKEISPKVFSKANRIGKGGAIYKHMCVYCHGVDGNGGGKATAYLYPWPRDFRNGVFKYRSTPSGSLPLDKDLYRTIAKGIPGTAMPAWVDSLAEEEIWSVIEYIKTFSDKFKNSKPKPPIVIGALPNVSEELLKKGQKLFSASKCNQCHGTDLKGDGPLADDLFDIWEHRAFVYDLTDPNNFKRGFDIKSIYLTLTSGVDGTPMKDYTGLSDSERWAISAFIASKVEKKNYKKAKYEDSLAVTRVKDEIIVDPKNSIWKSVPSKVVHLLPLNSRKRPIVRVKFQGIINDDAIAFRLEWEDESPNKSASRHQDFKDAIAMEFALGDVVLHKHGHNEPFFGMGNRGKVVNIWQWRADWQQDIETKEELEYATEDMDMDGMIFGGEVNPVDSINPFREQPVEELNAEGFGTLTPQPLTKQNVEGKGIWENGKWMVTFYRTLDSLNKWDIKFDGKAPLLVAFAIWDGEFRDIDGRKTVAMWQKLFLPENDVAK